MNKPSERIVVFVTPAQKRAISATADQLGISVSELMRRAVIAFSATGEQVKAASIVDRLNAPREPDALAQVLRKIAKPMREGRASPLSSAGAAVSSAGVESFESTAAAHADSAARVAQREAVPDLSLNAETALLDALMREQPHAPQPSPLQSPVAAPPSTGRAAHSAAQQIGEAVARLNAKAKDNGIAVAERANRADRTDDKPLRSLGAALLARATHPHGDADARHDGLCGGAPEDGKFA